MYFFFNVFFFKFFIIFRVHYFEDELMFFGNIYYKGVNFTEELLKKGFVYLIEDTLNFNYNYDIKL